MHVFSMESMKSKIRELFTFTDDENALQCKVDECDDEIKRHSVWVSMIGDLQAVTKFLASKPVKSFWLPLIFLDALSRGFAQVLFANNSLTGLAVIAGLFIGDPLVAAAGIFTTSVALITSVCLQQPRETTCAGLTSYSAVIVGTVVMALAPSYIETESYPTLWLFLFFGAIFSVYLTIALVNILKLIKPAVPCCTLPFNVVTFMTLISFQFITRQTTSEKDMVSNDNVNGTDVNVTSCDENHVQRLFVGTLVSMSQVYAVESIPSSIIIYLGLLVSSPITTVMAFIGSAVGTFLGAAILGPAGCAPAYSGLLGFNSLLSAGGVGGFFLVMSVHSFSTAVLCAMFTIVLQIAFASSLSVVSLPVCTLPFCTSTILFLATTTGHGGLVRPHALSFPERHLYDVHRARRKHSMTHLTEVRTQESRAITKTTQTSSPKLQPKRQ